MRGRWVFKSAECLCLEPVGVMISEGTVRWRKVLLHSLVWQQQWRSFDRSHSRKCIKLLTSFHIECLWNQMSQIDMNCCCLELQYEV